MGRVTVRPRTITIAQRGYIIQRVLVDGLSCCEAARRYGVEEQLVEAWIAAYRRDGMASLRCDPGPGGAVGLLRLRLSRSLRVLHRVAGTLFASSRRDEPAPPSPLRRSQDDRRGGS
jgi:transposase-like protein